MAVMAGNRSLYMNEKLRSQSVFASEKLGDRNHAVMGDNRDNSKDSRYFGVIPRDEIVGEATHVVMSFDKTDRFQPRWKRFFAELM